LRFLFSRNESTKRIFQKQIHETNLLKSGLVIHDTVRIHGFAKRIHVFTNLLYKSRNLTYFSHNKVLVQISTSAGKYPWLERKTKLNGASLIYKLGGLDSREQSRSRSRLSFMSRSTCRDKFLESVEIKTLNRDTIETNQDPQPTLLILPKGQKLKIAQFQF
jgi:hypothetical protein